MSARVSPSDFPEIRWHGHWIWVPEDKAEITPGIGLSDPRVVRQASNGLFRKTFALDAVPARVPVLLDLEGQAPQTLPAGQHEVEAGSTTSSPG
ncbi:MAG: hypothetical protein AB8I80_16150 [Anaerolineae bacterium]